VDGLVRRRLIIKNQQRGSHGVKNLITCRTR
jgi:hypothetical protein